jgi:hypothetical protein
MDIKHMWAQSSTCAKSIGLICNLTRDARSRWHCVEINRSNWLPVTSSCKQLIFFFFVLMEILELCSHRQLDHMASWKVNFAGAIDPGVFNVQQSTREWHVQGLPFRPCRRTHRRFNARKKLGLLRDLNRGLSAWQASTLPLSILQNHLQNKNPPLFLGYVKLQDKPAGQTLEQQENKITLLFLHDPAVAKAIARTRPDRP